MRDNLVLAVQRQRLIREGKLRAVVCRSSIVNFKLPQLNQVREGRRARVPLNTLKKEERWSNEIEEEEEEEERGGQ